MMYLLTYLLEIGGQDNSAAWHFERGCPGMEAAKTYAAEQAKPDKFWTVRDGSCTRYAFRTSEQN